MANTVNLSAFRKARARAEAKAQAATNRVVHGRTKAERDAAKAERERLPRLLDQTKLED